MNSRLSSGDRFAVQMVIHMRANNWMLSLLTVVRLSCGTLLSCSANPVLTRVPNAGIQPQAIYGSDHTLHMIYYKGDPKAGDLFYVRRAVEYSVLRWYFNWRRTPPRTPEPVA